MSTYRNISTLPLDALRAGSAMSEFRDSTRYNENGDKGPRPLNRGGLIDKEEMTPYAETIQRTNERLQKENEELRRCLVLVKENCELRTAAIVTSVLGLCDDRFKRFVTESFQPSNSRFKSTPLAPDTNQVMSPSYGGSFKPVGYSELASTATSRNDGPYQSPGINWRNEDGTRSEAAWTNEPGTAKRSFVDDNETAKSSERQTWNKMHVSEFRNERTTQNESSASRNIPELTLADLLDKTDDNAGRPQDRQRSPKESSRKDKRQTWQGAVSKVQTGQKSVKQQQPPMKFSLNPSPLKVSDLDSKTSPRSSPKRPSSPIFKERVSPPNSGRKSQESRGKERDSGRWGMIKNSLETGRYPDRADARPPILDGNLVFQRKFRYQDEPQDISDQIQANARAFDDTPRHPSNKDALTKAEYIEQRQEYQKSASPIFKERLSAVNSGRQSHESRRKDTESGRWDAIKNSLGTGRYPDRAEARQSVLEERLDFQRSSRYQDAPQALSIKVPINARAINNTQRKDKNDTLSKAEDIEQFRGYQKSPRAPEDKYYFNDMGRETLNNSDFERNFGSRNQQPRESFEQSLMPRAFDDQSVGMSTMQWGNNSGDRTLTEQRQPSNVPRTPTPRNDQSERRDERQERPRDHNSYGHADRGYRGKSSDEAGSFQDKRRSSDRQTLRDVLVEADQKGSLARDFGTPLASSTPVATRNLKYQYDSEPAGSGSSQRRANMPSNLQRLASFSSETLVSPEVARTREPVSLTGSRSYESLGRPVAQSTPREKPDERVTHNDSISSKALAQLIGFQGNGAAEKADYIIHRPVDSILNYRPIVSHDTAITLSRNTPNRRLVGEIAFQLDRRILAYIFDGVWKDDPDRQKSRFYGYSLVNIIPMIQKELQSEGIDSKELENVLLSRLEKMLEQLKLFEYSFNTHARFTQKMVNTYGLLKSAPNDSIVDAFGLDDPAVLRIVIGQILKDEDQLHHMLIILDCLCYLSHQDKRPLFMW